MTQMRFLFNTVGAVVVIASLGRKKKTQNKRDAFVFQTNVKISFSILIESLSTSYLTQESARAIFS